MMVLVGIGTRDAALAGMTMVVAHAMFKAALFMVVGIIDHTTGTRDLRKLAHLGKAAPALAIIASLAAASMAGLPPLLGFVGKEAALESVLETNALGHWSSIAVVTVIVLGSILTVGYSVRFIWGAFGRKTLSKPSPAVSKMHKPGWLFLFAPGLLAVLGLAAGILSPQLEKLLTPYSTTLAPGPHADYHLALWQRIQHSAAAHLHRHRRRHRALHRAASDQPPALRAPAARQRRPYLRRRPCAAWTPSRCA